LGQRSGQQGYQVCPVHADVRCVRAIHLRWHNWAVRTAHPKSGYPCCDSVEVLAQTETPKDSLAVLMEADAGAYLAELMCLLVHLDTQAGRPKGDRGW
jgi:hypothetical protein